MKNHKKQIFVLIFISAIIIGLFLIVSCARGLELNWPTAPGGKELTDDSSLVDFVDYAYRWGIFLGGLAAFVALVIAGFQFLTSVGDPNRMKEARQRIIAAISGLVLLLSSYVILNTLNPDLTTLSPPTPNISGLPVGEWQPPEWNIPCEFVILYPEKNYQGKPLEIGKGHEYNYKIEACISTSICIPIIPFLWCWDMQTTEIKSVKMKGACQLNLYEEDGCKGNFIAIGKSMPNLDWINQSHIFSIRASDVSPPERPGVENADIGPPVPQGDGKYKITLKGKVTDFGRADKVVVHFEYGENELYLDKTAPSNVNEFEEIYVQSTPVFFQVEVKDLATSTTYYWRAVAANEAGATLADISSFTTGP